MPVANSTKAAKNRKAKAEKPENPYKNYHLFAHVSGRWAKKILGELHCFGRWGDKRGSEIIPIDDVVKSAQKAVDLYNKKRAAVVFSFGPLRLERGGRYAASARSLSTARHPPGIAPI